VASGVVWCGVMWYGDMSGVVWCCTVGIGVCILCLKLFRTKKYEYKDFPLVQYLFYEFCCSD
jgi:hypothetical protein